MRNPAILLVVAALVLPVVFWLQAVEGLRDFMSYRLPPGQAAYVLSKLFGLLSLTLVSLQIFLMVDRRMNLLVPPSNWTNNHHRILGVATASVVLIHVLLFFLAVSLRENTIAWHLFSPNLVGGSYARGLSLGVIGFWLLVLTIPFGILAAHTFRVASKLLHRLIIGVLFLGTVHGLWIGSEKEMIMLISTFSAVIGLLVLRRWISTRTARGF